MATLTYDFRVVGAEAVHRAFASIERRAETAASRLNRSFAQVGVPGAGAGGAAAPGAAVRQDVAQQLRARRNLLNNLENLEQQSLQRIADNRRRLQQRAMMEEDLRQRRFYRAGIRNGAIMGGVGALSNLYSRAMTGVKLGVGGLMAAGIQGHLATSRTSALLAIQSKQAGNPMSLRDIQNGIMASTKTVSQMTGASRESVIAGMAAFHGAAGSLDAAKEIAPFMQDVVDATGASMAEVGRAAGMAFMQAAAGGLKGKEATNAVKQIIGAIAGQAAAGTFEFKDFASSGPSILATAGRFGGSYSDMVNVVTAIAQNAPGGGTTSPAQAAMSLARFADDISKKAPLYRKLGIETFAPGGTLRNPQEIIEQMVARTGGNEEKLNQFQLNERAVRAVRGFVRVYREAGGGEQGMEAVHEAFEKFKRAALSVEQVAEGAAFAREQPGHKFEAAFNELKNAMADSLVPAITELVPKFAELAKSLGPVIEQFGKFAQWAVENPKTAAALYVGKEIGGGVLGGAFNAALTGYLVRRAIGGLAVNATTTAATTIGTTAAATEATTALEALATAAEVAGGASVMGAFGTAAGIVAGAAAAVAGTTGLVYLLTQSNEQIGEDIMNLRGRPTKEYDPYQFGKTAFYDQKMLEERPEAPVGYRGNPNFQWLGRNDKIFDPFNLGLEQGARDFPMSNFKLGQNVPGSLGTAPAAGTQIAGVQTVVSSVTQAITNNTEANNKTAAALNALAQSLPGLVQPQSSPIGQPGAGGKPLVLDMSLVTR